MHLTIVRAQEPPVISAPPAPPELDATILQALECAGRDGLARASLRAAVHVRNERLGEALLRLAAAEQIARRGESWVRVSLSTPETDRNGNALPPHP